MTTLPPNPTFDGYDESSLFGAAMPAPMGGAPQPQPRPAAQPAYGQNPVPTGNPLLKFRMPGLHIGLPTRGAFLPPGSLETTGADDLPVFPMRAADEMLLKSPDALMSGYAVERLIESCVPAIKAPRLVSAPDLDVLLIAIRAATYGDVMEVDAACPKCRHENSFDCHLPTIIGTMTRVDPENPVRLSDDMVLYLRPFNIHQAGQISMATFAEARKFQAMEERGAPEAERMRALNESYEKIAKLNLMMLGQCIIKVAIPGDVVTDPAMIGEFVDQISPPWLKKIDAVLQDINARGIDKTIHVQCAKCSHGWSTQVEFNPANFFAPGS